LIFHFEYRLATTFANMDVNGPMFVAIEEKPESILYENSWHVGNEQWWKSLCKQKGFKPNFQLLGKTGANCARL